MTEEIYSQIEHIATPCSEVFPDVDELEVLAAKAVEHGIVKIVEFEQDPAKPTQYPSLRVNVAITPDELRSFPDDAKEWDWADKAFDELAFKDPTKAQETASLAVVDKVIDRTLLANAWYLKDPKTAELVEDGQVTESFELTTEGGRIPVVNFGETVLSEEQVESIRKVMDKVCQASAGNVFDVVNAICILPKSSFEGLAIGNTNGFSGVIELSEALIDGSSEARAREKGIVPKFSELGLNYLEMTLTHESWHLLELLDKKQMHLQPQQVGAMKQIILLTTTEMWSVILEIY